MLDKIKITQKVDISDEQLQKHFWQLRYFTPENDQAQNDNLSHLADDTAIPYYKYTGYRNISITYWPESRNLNINNRLSAFSRESNKVTVLGDFYRQNKTHDLFSDINSLLYRITGLELDVMNFKPRIYEPCFNLKTQYVSEYITLLNQIFQFKDPQKYRNYVLEKGLDMGSSVYIKSRSEYEHNSKQNFVLNIYNKEDQLKNLHAGIENRGQYTVHDYDIKEAKNILRVEVQCYSILSSRTFKKNNMNYADRTLADLLDPDFCLDIIRDKIISLFGQEIRTDFYTYEAAKAMIEASDLNKDKKEKLYNYVLKFSRNQLRGMKTSRIRDCQRLLAELGIHYFLIPKSMNVSYLPSIITLLDDHVDELKQQHTAASTMTATDDVMAEPAIKDNFNDYSPLYMNEAIKESASPINEVAEIMPKVKWSYIGQAPDQFLLSYSTRVRPRDPPTPTTRQSIYVFENYFADKAEYHIFGMYKNRHG